MQGINTIDTHAHIQYFQDSLPTHNKGHNMNASTLHTTINTMEQSTMNTYILETMEQAKARASAEVLAILAEPELVLGMGTGDAAGDIPATATTDTKGTQAPTTAIPAQWAAMERAHNNMVRFTSAWRKGFDVEAYKRAQLAIAKAEHKAIFPALYASNGTLRNLNSRKFKSMRVSIVAEMVNAS
jgi:hypothetical protein